jgi:GT2 family glycosyltransferase
MSPTRALGVILIGRNEGDRLRRCILSVQKLCASDSAVVYVDSGSTDGSQSLATSLGVSLLPLDLTRPFTAGRARNEGAALLADAHSPQYLLFLDGDCELVPGFIEAATAFLNATPTAAAVAGRRRERHPEASLYNRLCDMEWNTPIGPATEIGGDALYRASAFQTVGGFNPDIIAGEEPDLCVRLRSAGWQIFRLDAEMTLHDAAMTRFGQWWKRSIRAGHAFAEGAWRHSGVGHWVRPALRVWLWTVILPIAIVGAVVVLGPWALLLCAAYLKPVTGAARSRLRRGDSPRDSFTYAIFCLIAKFAELAGQLKFLASRLTRRQTRIIEYKAAAS